MRLITEIGKNVLPGLDKIDLLFKELKTGKNVAKRGQTLVKMENQLEKIFGSPFTLEIEYLGPYSDNFVVIPILKQAGKITTKEDFVSLGNVKKMNIIVGMELVKELRPRELTAIMLHEIGHVAEHISQSVIKLYNLLWPIHKVTNFLTKLPIIGLLLIPIFIITSRSLSWTQHVFEFSADKFAVKYGYGDELASAAHKWAKSDQKYNKLSGKTLMQKLGIIADLFSGKVFGVTHPKNEDRIKAIVQEMKKNYSNQYKSKRLQKILDYYKLN